MARLLVPSRRYSVTPLHMGQQPTAYYLTDVHVTILSKTIMSLQFVFLSSLLLALAMPVSARDIEETRLDKNCESTLMLSEIAKTTKPVDVHGIKFIVYPETIPDNFSGCQVVWLANGHKLATKHYEAGKVTWMRGQEPKEVRPFFCMYEAGNLDVGASFNTKHCPKKADELL